MFPQNIQSILNMDILQNTVDAYGVALGLFVILSITFAVAQKVIYHNFHKLVRRTKTGIDDLFLDIFSRVGLPLYIYLAFFIAVQTLKLPGVISQALVIILLAWIIYKTVVASQLIIDFLLGKYLRREKDALTQQALKNVATIIKVLLWIFGGFLILSNLGIDVTSLLAGLGIGGIAIALALQNVLGDLFSSFAIYFDKPFVVGDFIIVGDKMGVVDRIGIKTTRIRALQGEEVVISNKDLTSNQVQNFGRMKERRVPFTFGVLYETPQDKLKKIPAMIKKIITGVKHTRFDRVHFARFDDSALSFDVVYYVTSSDYALFMDIQQEINFAINEAFAKEGISMAYPTRTVYLAKN